MTQPATAAVTGGLTMPVSTIGCRQCHELYSENCELRRDLEAMRKVAEQLRECLKALRTHLRSRMCNE